MTTEQTYPPAMRDMLEHLQDMITKVEAESGKPDVEMRAKLDELRRAMDEGVQEANATLSAVGARPVDVARQLGEVEARIARVESLAADVQGDKEVQEVLGSAAPALQAMLDKTCP